MKSQADKHRLGRTFAVNDKVYLKLQPHVQSSVARRACHKLSFKFFGPFVITARIGEVAYRLALPTDSKIHPVFHVSQLKPCVGPGQKVLPTLPDSDALYQVPIQVLQRRVRQHGLRTIVQALIQWSGQPEATATWDDLEALKQRFPLAPAWGQAAFQDPGNVSDHSSTTSTPEDGLQRQQLKMRPIRTRRAPGWLAGQEWAK